MDIQPFNIHVDERLLVDLKQRLGNIRWPRSLDAESWDDGASLAFMQRLTEYWRSRFDWRAQEARLNQLPQFQATIDGLSIHFVHQRGTGPKPLPVIMTHGWPGSFVEMEKIIPLLTDPARHGGDPDDAFHVIVPSLPGYGFSEAPDRQGFSSSRIAGLWLELMNGLGYPRFGAQGGDIGAGVSTWLAHRFPESIVGFHLNYISGGYRPPLGEGLAPITAEEQAFLDTAAAWAAAEGAYAHMHGTKPQTLAYALNDSPVGLAAWIVEKFLAWSDCGGDVEQVFSLDALLTTFRSTGFQARSTLQLDYTRKIVSSRFISNPANACSHRSAWLCFRVNYRCRRALGSNAATPLPAGQKCPEVATSPRWNSPICWRRIFGRSSGR